MDHRQRLRQSAGRQYGLQRSHWRSWSRLVGNDTLDGGPGADTMIGGTGNDTYVVDNAGDVVTENAGEGTDTVQTSLASYTLPANVENLTFTDNGTHTGNGNALANVVTG